MARAVFAAAPATQPAFWTFALQPPMGWNSYDSYGDTVTEPEVLANAAYMQTNLLSHGWNYIVVDFRWYDPGATGGNPNDRAGVHLTADEFGRLTPALNRFPSAADGKGFAPLADKIHAMGLQFGIHIMRGIPRQTVAANPLINGSAFHAADAADTSDKCAWCADMYGVKGNTDAGQAWYNSLLDQYALWNIDYIKVDDISHPYHADEIAAIRRAIDQCGRPIVLSLSPGPTPPADAENVKMHANLWRISNDFWDRWRSLNGQFDLIDAWQKQAGPGHWPDADMIPFGHLGPRCPVNGRDRQTRLTHDEQRTLISLWALAPSPLMLGMNLPDNDTWTQNLLTNDNVLAINQDLLGAPGSLIGNHGDLEVWKKPLADGSLAVGLFNRSASDAEMTATWQDLGLTIPQNVVDLWENKNLGTLQNQVKMNVPTHGAALLHLTGIAR
jgi:hypothetical protein